VNRSLIAAALIFAAAGAAFAQSRDVAGKFDYYALALSWSPSYCAQPGMAKNEPRQCAIDRQFAFVVHGLWPQYERGYPQSCASTMPRRAPAPLVDSQLDLMPSPNLVQHEWETHGRCTGLSQANYFATLRQMRGKIAIPPSYARLEKPLRVTAADVRAAFVRANPGLAPDGLAVICDRTRLREVRVCFNKGGGLRKCSVSVRDQCSAGAVTMPPVRLGQTTR
jgi:ribonuclease T2